MRIETVHGENQSLFHIVDETAPETEQPFIVETYNRREDADVRLVILKEKEMAKKIEDLAVYRETISLGTRLYGLKTSHDSAVHAKVRETSLSMVLNLASGLGFWEKEWKLHHLKATKRALMELPPLLELMVALGEMKPEMEHIFGVSIGSLAEKVQRLIRAAGKDKEGKK